MTVSKAKTKIQAKAPPMSQDQPPGRGSTLEWPVSERTVPENEVTNVAGLLHIEEEAWVSIRRLIVLIPGGDLDEAEIARRVWDMAAPAGLAVLFFGLCRDTTEELSMQRRLTILASLTRDPRVPVETRLELEHGWLQKLGATYGRGDVILCLAEQPVGPWRKPIGRVLAKRGLPVWTLEGLYSPTNTSSTRRVREVIFWIVAIIIIAGFFSLQASITRLSEDWARSGMMYFSVLVEVGLLWIWHSVSL